MRTERKIIKSNRFPYLEIIPACPLNDSMLFLDCPNCPHNKGVNWHKRIIVCSRDEKEAEK